MVCELEVRREKGLKSTFNKTKIPLECITREQKNKPLFRKVIPWLDFKAAA